MRRPKMMWFAGIFAALFIFGSLFTTLSAAPTSWTLKDLDGGRYTLSENLGNGPTMLLFWATWCRPCKQEMKEYKSVFEAYREKGVQILAIAEDNSKTQSKVRSFIRSVGYEFTVLLDPTREVLKSYGGVSLPYTVILDSTGEVQKVYRGKIQKIDELSELLEKLLEDPSSE
ncbi:TlpA family protein disulfide reductase [bacterium]|nr:TlpA family protein disulfide reductase [bacterium]